MTHHRHRHAAFVALLAALWLSLALGVAPSLAAQEAAEWYLDKPIADIRFLGLDAVAESDLEPIVRPYLGQDFTLDLFWELQNRLYATDLFDQLESNAVPVDDRRQEMVVEFAVTERPTVADLTIAGNRRIRTLEITDVVLLKTGDVFTGTAANADRDAIRALYLEKGYTDALVDYETERDEEQNTVAVTFRITEGSRVTIEEILFDGNEFASEGTLRRQMDTKRRSLLDTGAFEEAKLQADKAGIERYYASNGYVDAEVLRIERDVVENEDENRTFLRLTVYLEEGEQFTYGGFGFEGNGIFSDEELAALVRHRPDTVLNRQIVDTDFQRIQDQYFDDGYIFNDIRLVEDRDERARTIAFTVTIVERQRAHIENIIITGNEKTQDFVLMRELPFEVGDVFSKTQIVQGWRNLLNTQYFSAVTPDTVAGSTEGLMDVLITVEEQPTADVNFGLTFSGAEFPVSGTIAWNERNLLGVGQTLGAGIEVSPLRQAITLNFTEPWLTGVRWSLGGSIRFEHDLVRNVPQDVLAPIFTTEQWEAGNAVPDPYDGHLVDPDSGLPATQQQIDDETAITDWAYARQEGIVIDNAYTMDYDALDIALGVTTGYRVGTRLGFLGATAGLSTSLEFLTYDSTILRPYEPAVRENLDSWILVDSLSTTLSWDARDFLLNPSSGFLLSQSANFTGGLLFGDRHFTRLTTRAEAFLTLWDVPVFQNWNYKTVLAAHSAFGVVLPQLWVPDGFRNLEADSSDLLVIDGTRVARGWDPITEGHALWESKIELRTPIAEEIVWGVAFFDSAVMWRRDDTRCGAAATLVCPQPGVLDLSTASLDDYYFSVGAGFRFAIPQFPIRIYLAKGFQFDDDGTYQPKPGSWILGDDFSLDFVISLGGEVF